MYVQQNRTNEIEIYEPSLEPLRVVLSSPHSHPEEYSR